MSHAKSAINMFHMNYIFSELSCYHDGLTLGGRVHAVV